MNVDVDEEAVLAAANLVGRTGATDLTVGYLDDDVPPGQQRWWAKAQYAGANIMVEDHPGAEEALTALAERLLTGAQCQLCGGLVALRDGGAMAFPNAPRPDGKRWTKKEIEAAGQCRWERRGPRWESGCIRSPEGDDEIHSAEKLARALDELDDPRVRPLVWRARRGFYHDYLSPLADNTGQLISDLRALGLHEFASRVKDGEFDATGAESDAWARSPDGRETFNALLGDRESAASVTGVADPPKASGAAFWQTQRPRRPSHTGSEDEND